jgi:predicted nucleic acid-binding protein
MPSYLDEFIEGMIYVEANIFLLTALADAKYGPSALGFLERSSGDEVEFLTSTLTIDEVSFVALKAKLEEKYSVTRNQVLYLKRNPEVVKALASDVNRIVENVLSLTTLVEVSAPDIQQMRLYMEEFGLLPRDAIHLAVAHRLGLTCMASSDSDFDRVPWLTRYAPRET